MTHTTLFWIYVINTIFLINHETDSAYWHEWKLFKIPGGISTFLIIHFPMWFAVLFGMIELYSFTFTGMIFSLILSGVGIFAFCIHTYFIKKGNPEFKTPVSQFILISILFISLAQLALTLYIFISQNGGILS